MSDIVKEIKKILDQHKVIGIFISGGLDSAVLAYLLHKYKSEDHEFLFYTVPRYDDSFFHAKRIIKYLDDEFNYSNRMPILLGSPDLHHSQQVLSGIRIAVRQHKAGVLVLGDTALPYDQSLSTEQSAPIRNRSDHWYIKQPFIDFTKKDTVQLAVDMNLTQLIELSHTCTESKLLRCNVCWQCRERAWAFKECGKVDLGTM